SLVVPHAPALSPGPVVAPDRRPAGLDGQRHTHYCAHCSGDVVVAGRGPRWLPLAGRLDRFFAGWAWFDYRNAAISPLYWHDPVSLCYYGPHAICNGPADAAISNDGDHGSDICRVQRGRLALSLARDHDGYSALGVP